MGTSSLKVIFTFYIIISSTVSRASVVTESITPEIKQEIDNFVNGIYLPSNNNPGLSLAITNGNGSLLYATGFGLMDVANELPTTNETLFLIGSISKSFAAVVVCKTSHEKFPELGNRAIDTPIRKLIPEFNFTLNDRYRSEATTFRDMLSHRVCSKPDGIATLMVPFKNTNEMAYRQRYADELCNFRTSLAYNNELLNDLEMYNTTIVRDSDEDELPNRAVPYYWRNGEKHNYNPKLLKRVSLASAAGGIMSSAADMAKYLQFHLNKGKVGDRQAVPQRVMEWLYQVAINVFANSNLFKPNEVDIPIGYGLGLFQSISDGWQKVSHGGQVPPFESNLSFYPGKDIGIFTSTNQGPVNDTLDNLQLHRAIFDTLRGIGPGKRELVNFNKDSDSLEKEDNVKVKSNIVSDNFVGSYGNGLQGEVEITLKQRDETKTIELYMNYGQWGQAYLLGTETEKKFLIHWDSDVVQDKYAMGDSGNDAYGIFNEDITEFQIVDNGLPSEKFQKGVNLDPVDRGVVNEHLEFRRRICTE